MPNSLQTRSKTTTNAELIERSAIMEDMSAALKEEVEEIASEINEPTISLVMSRWKLGDRLSKIRDNKKVYGANSLEKVFSYFGEYHRSTLVNATKLRDCYTEAAIKDAIEMKSPTGRILELSHLVEICRLPAKPQRLEWQKKVVNDGITVRDLNSEIDKVLDKPASRIPGSTPLGPPLKCPNTLNGILEQMRSNVSLVKRRAEEVWSDAEKGLVYLYDQTPPDKLAELQPKIQETEAVVEETIDGLDSLLRELRVMDTNISSRKTKPLALPNPFGGEDDEEEEVEETEEVNEEA